jgi:PAS domain S-box-containing protein
LALPFEAITIALFGLLLVAGIWGYTIERAHTETLDAQASEFRKNANLALALDLQTNQLLKGIDQFLLIMKQQHARYGAGADVTQLAAARTPAMRPFTFIGLVDADGNVTTAGQPFVPTNVSDREMFKHQSGRAIDGMLISDPVMGRISGRSAITMSRRIEAADGSFGGVAAIAIEPSYLTELFERASLGPADVLSLTLTSGTVLARRAGDTISFGEDLRESQLLAEQRRAAQGNYIGPGGLDGKTRIFSYRTLADYPVIVTVGTLVDDVLAPVHQRVRNYRVTAGVASAFIVTFCAIMIVALARQRRADLQIREQASLLDKAQDAIVVLDLEARVRYWNRSAERVYGWPEAEAIGCEVALLFHRQGDTTGLDGALDRVRRSGEWTGEFHHVAKDGREVIAETRWTLVRDAAGAPHGLLLIITDITARKKLEQQFLRSQRLESIGTLAGGIAHDLNNVLTPIMLAAECLKENPADPTAPDLVATIGESARRGADMVRQVLSFARGLEGRRIQLQARNLLAEVENIARDTFPKNIQIDMVIAPGLWALTGDPTQLHQVLINLSVNARDAMPDGGRLTLSAVNLAIDADNRPKDFEVPEGPYVVITVADNGTGMPPEVLDRMFDPFFTTKDVGKGTGLGLSTSAAIVKSHGGRIRCTSRVGVGARFEVFLPALGTAAAPAAATPVARQAGGGGMTVLLVDDEESIRRVTKMTLESLGYRVLVAADGAQALSLYASNRDHIAAVLTDMTMPVMDGSTTIQALMKIDHGIRIVAMSGIPANEMIARQSGAAVKQFLSKPFSAEALARALAVAVSRR